MASLLRTIVAGPRAPDPETGIDLCYVTDNIIATSGPAGTYPSRAYRTPLSHLVKYLDSKHGSNWAIWEFRAEGTGYPDSAVDNRIWHYPWPDHHPPPFALIPNMVASMRNWLHEHKDRVAVVHCKAGKGRSGSASCAYLISEEGWAMEDALKRFTERRMRPGKGNGLSIPSQLRWIGYVDRWNKGGKVYVERKVDVQEIKVYGMRDGVKLSVQGFVEEGKVIETFHVFDKKERHMLRGEAKDKAGVSTKDMADVVTQAMNFAKSTAGYKPKPVGDTPSRNDSKKGGSIVRSLSRRSKKTSEKNKNLEPGSAATSGPASPIETPSQTSLSASNTNDSPSTETSGTETPTGPEGGDVLFKPSKPIILPTSDINIDFERRSHLSPTYNFSLLTSVAHVWFNVFFEGNGPENFRADKGPPESSGTFSLNWEELDGIKGSSNKGTKQFDRIEVLWKAVSDGDTHVIVEPEKGECVGMSTAADWRGRRGTVDEGDQRVLGLGKRAKEGDHKADTEQAKAPIVSLPAEDDSGDEGIQAHGLHGESKVDLTDDEATPTAGPKKSLEKTFSDPTVNTSAQGAEKDVGDIEKTDSPASLKPEQGKEGLPSVVPEQEKKTEAQKQIDKGQKQIKEGKQRVELGQKQMKEVEQNKK